MTRDFDELRAAIAEQDAQIIAHLGRRLELVAEVADVKGRDSIAVMQPGQVATVLARVERLAEKEGIRVGFLTDVYERIIAEACRVEDARLGASRTGSGRVVVLGGGVAGQIARRLLGRCGFDCATVDLDPQTSPDLVADAADVDRLAPLLHPADVVVFATPVSVTLRALASVVPALSSRTIVVDFMSSKLAVAHEIEALGLTHQVMGLNPLFGSALRPVRPALLHVPYRDGPQARSLVVALQEAGVELIDCPDAGAHDSVCARWQALTHATALAFGLASVSLGEDFDRSGQAAPPPHRLLRAVLARMLRAADPATYEEIQFAAPSAAQAREALSIAAAELAAGGVESWRRAWGDLHASIPVAALADGEQAFLGASRALMEGL
jgi:4-amino-4-deoxyprephenate dehydrogenase